MTISASTLSSVRHFLNGIVDYAGLFPPARLPLDEAINNFARYRLGNDAWMLGKFVIPANLLPALDTYEALFQNSPPSRFSVLGTPGPEFLRNLKNDLKAIDAFEMRHHDRVAVDAMEVKSDELGDDAGLVDAMESAAEILRQNDRDRLSIYIEVPWHQHSDDRLASVAEAAAYVRKSKGAPLALKIRSGGLESELFPDSVRLARFIALCLRSGVPFKATAGLHHPVRLFHESVQTRMHGFLNVFGGAALLHSGCVSEEELVTLLEDEDPASFAFDTSGMQWRDREISLEGLASARQFAHSFGSCSFDEPRDDLRALDLL